MKKLLPLSLLSLCTAAALAQTGQIVSMEKVNLPVIKGGSSNILSSDTITKYYDRATNFYTLKAGPAGYILGTGTTTTETACHYDAVGNVSITHVVVYLGVKKVMGSADNVTFKAYTAGPDSMPLAVAASGIRSVNQIPINAPTFIPLTSQMSNVSGDFLVSMEYGSLDDTLSIISTNPTTNAGGPDGKFEKRTRQNTSLGWKRSFEIWSGAGGGYNADALVMPIVSFATGTNSLQTPAFELYRPFPCPAANNITLSYFLKENTSAEIIIYNEAGSTVRKFDRGATQGKQELNIDLTTYAAGNYFFRVKAGSSTLMSSFSVTR